VTQQDMAQSMARNIHLMHVYCTDVYCTVENVTEPICVITL